MSRLISLGDEELREYLYLKEAIKLMTQRIKVINDACKELGSFCTAQYVCAVTVQKRTHLVGLGEVKKYISEDILNKYNLIKVTSADIVKIAPMPDVLYPSISIEELESVLKREKEANP